MNHVFHILANKAWIDAPNGEGYAGKIFDKKLFAEMIVQECINNLEIHSTCFDGDVGRGVKTAARLTREHFGVKQ